MTRRFTGGRLVIASHNKGKVREIGDLLRPFHVEAVSAGDLGLPEPDETGTTYIENAELKARAAATAANLPALADDSGFGVRALNGDPGLYSARWAGPSKDFTFAMRTVWDKMQATGNPDRHGEFVCALSLAWPDGHCESFEGRLPVMRACSACTVSLAVRTNRNGSTACTMHASPASTMLRPKPPATTKCSP